jgi:hypothetical protein
LQFKDPKTCELLARAGFSYDSTSSYHDCSGFRNGITNISVHINLTQEKKLIFLNPSKHDGYKSFQPDISRLQAIMGTYRKADLYS